MVSIIIVEKNGDLKSLSIKSYNEAELFKKAGFKVETNFKCHANWKLNISNTKVTIYMYAKSVGRAGQENKYEFPPPISDTLFYGNCILLGKYTNTDEIYPLTINEWKYCYEHLYGGIIDLDGKDEVLSEDSELSQDYKKTKEGYILDGFVVNDREIKTKQKSKLRKIKNTPLKAKATSTADDIIIPTKDEMYLDCSSELKEEEYFY